MTRVSFCELARCSETQHEGRCQMSTTHFSIILFSPPLEVTGTQTRRRRDALGAFSAVLSKCERQVCRSEGFRGGISQRSGLVLPSDAFHSLLLCSVSHGGDQEQVYAVVVLQRSCCVPPFVAVEVGPPRPSRWISMKPRLAWRLRESVKSSYSNCPPFLSWDDVKSGFSVLFQRF